jgi:hypothetical protein
MKIKMLFGLIVAAVLVFIAAVLTNSPANAGNCSSLGCGSMTHYAPDDGYDSPMLVRCQWGDNATNFLLYEGSSSTSHCRDLDQIYVRPGENYRCRGWSGSYGWYWTGAYDATGWHKIYDGENKVCVLNLD